MTPRDEVWYKLGRLDGELSVTPLDQVTDKLRQKLTNALNEIEKTEDEAPKFVYVTAVKNIICSCGHVHRVQARLEVLDNMDAKYTIEGEK
jgi:UDP-2,3-diacylglucosamine pyrophosphatase LpxH